MKSRANNSQSSVMQFAKAILHGDQTHRDWLLEAAQCWEAGKPIPAPRSDDD